MFQPRHLLLLLLPACGAPQSAERLGAPESEVLPNVVLILADDLGWGDLACYSSQSLVPTPALDSLAADGLKFTDAHSPSSVCSPTRYALLTGRYAWRSELKQSVVWEWGRPLLEEERATLPELLRTRGYQTACIGKWHLGWTWLDSAGEAVNDELPFWPRSSEARTRAGERVDLQQPMRGGPTAHGFDSYFGDDVPNFPPRAWIRDDRVLGTATEPKPKGMFGVPGPTESDWDLAAVMPRLADEAVQYIESREASRQPFFLYLPLTAPHTPIAPSPAFAGKTEAGAYGDFVAEVDWVVGRVLQALEQSGERDNTVVIFSSDNGSPARDGEGMSGAIGSVTRRFGHAPNGPWRGLKADAWEAGHRVPLIVDWPGRTTAGQASQALVGLHDLYATFSEALDIPIPAGEGIDSESFLAVLESPSSTGRSEIIHHTLDGTFAVRRGTWKLIDGNLGSGGFSQPSRVQPGPGDPGGQLFDLSSDPQESTNLWAEYPGRVDELQKWLATTRDRSRDSD